MFDDETELDSGGIADLDPSAAPTRADPEPGLTAEAAEIEEAPQRIGPYHLRRKLGEGGMGEVWLAEQVEPVRRNVALKIIKPGMDSHQVVSRFEAERQALARMEHSAIAKVLDAGATVAGRPYFVMEFVDGVPLSEHCDREGLTVRKRLELFVAVCEGVQHAHQKAVIHRDLKPGNVLVTLQDGKPVPKIIDFGVAKALDEKLTDRTLQTQLGAWIGTPAYMSPEQIGIGEEGVDTRADVYALGVMLYEVVAGALPFDLEDLRRAGLEGMLRKIREDEPLRPSVRLATLGDASTTAATLRGTELPHLRRELSGDLDWITMRAMEKDRERRYPSPEALGADIRRYLNHEPVDASPPSTVYRMGKFVRRNRVGVAVGVAAAVGLLAFSVTTSIQAGRIASERDRAQLEAETATQISEFLTGLFEMSDPEESRGNQVTARELLDRGSARVAGELRDQPRLQARLMSTMGEVYRSLGVYGESATMLEPSLARLRELHGDDHEDTLVAMTRLGLLRWKQGRYDEAEALYEEALQAHTRQDGRDHPSSLGVLLNLGQMYADEGRLDQAEPLQLEVLEGYRAHLGEDHRRTLIAAQNLGTLYWKQGRRDEAEALLASTVARIRSALGEDHPLSLSARMNLALVYTEQGRHDESEALLLETLESSRRVLGEDHSTTLLVLNELSAVYIDQNRDEEAVALQRDLLDRRRRVLGDEHPHTLSSMGNLANGLAGIGAYEEAEALFVETVELQRRVLGPDHTNTLTGLNNLAMLYQRLGRLPAARRSLEQAVEAASGRKGDRGYPIYVHSLGEVLMAEGKLEQARSRLRQALDLYDAAGGHRFAGLAAVQLAEVAARRRDRDEGVAWVQRALDEGQAPAFLDNAVFEALREDPRVRELLGAR